MRRIALFGLLTLLALPTLPAQASNGIDVGTLIGAGLGGVIGNQIGKGTGNTVATVAGVILGGVAGHSVDQGWSSETSQRTNTIGYATPEPVRYAYRPNYVAPYAPPPSIIYSQYHNDNDGDDDNDNYRYHHRHHNNHRHGQPNWQQPVLYEQDTIVQQTYVPASYQPPVVQQGYCREYTGHVVVNGRSQNNYGTACLQPDGSWKIIN